MSGQHTPGPWLARVQADGEIFIVLGPEGDEGGTILEGGFVCHDDDTNLANAQLMAAAPELYEAVASLLELIADIEQDGHRMTAEQVAFARDCEASHAKASPSTPSTKA